jgi:membrane-bound lytic murein transglycosylase A
VRAGIAALCCLALHATSATAHGQTKSAPQASHTLYTPITPWPTVDLADWMNIWTAWKGSCQALTNPRHPHWQQWHAVCQLAEQTVPNDGAQVLAYFRAHFDLYQARDPHRRDPELGLATGYFEPELDARLSPGDPDFTHPLYRQPAVTVTKTRAQLEASKQLSGLEVAWFSDPVAAFFLEVQGSGLIRLPNGDRWRLSYAGNNGHPYRSVGRWLIDQHELDPSQVSMQAIGNWARQHPQRLHEMLNQNPRVIFFAAQPLGDQAPGPSGSLGIPLSAGVSAAVDPTQTPQGAVLLVSPLRHDGGGPLPDDLMVNRALVAQDTGSAIKGPLRIDWFWGTGAEAGEIAGRQHTVIRLYVLVPHGVSPDTLLEAGF